MTRIRISSLARADLAQIFATSTERWGTEGKRRYAALVGIAIRKIASEPEGTNTRARPELSRSIRNFHLRHAHIGEGQAHVKKPVHVLYYRIVRPGLVEIVRVLHERMEPSRHIAAEFNDDPSS